MELLITSKLAKRVNGSKTFVTQLLQDTEFTKGMRVVTKGELVVGADVNRFIAALKSEYFKTKYGFVDTRELYDVFCTQYPKVTVDKTIFIRNVNRNAKNGLYTSFVDTAVTGKKGFRLFNLSATLKDLKSYASYLKKNGFTGSATTTATVTTEATAQTTTSTSEATVTATKTQMGTETNAALGILTGSVESLQNDVASLKGTEKQIINAINALANQVNVLTEKFNKRFSSNFKKFSENDLVEFVTAINILKERQDGGFRFSVLARDFINNMSSKISENKIKGYYTPGRHDFANGLLVESQRKLNNQSNGNGANQ